MAAYSIQWRHRSGNNLRVTKLGGIQKKPIGLLRRIARPMNFPTHHARYQAKHAPQDSELRAAGEANGAQDLFCALAVLLTRKWDWH